MGEEIDEKIKRCQLLKLGEGYLGIHYTLFFPYFDVCLEILY